MDSKGSDRPVPVPLPVELEEKKKRATDPHFGNRSKSCTISTRLSGSLARRVGSGDLGIFLPPQKGARQTCSSSRRFILDRRGFRNADR